MRFRSSKRESVALEPSNNMTAPKEPKRNKRDSFLAGFSLAFPAQSNNSQYTTSSSPPRSFFSSSTRAANYTPTAPSSPSSGSSTFSKQSSDSTSSSISVPKAHSALGLNTLSSPPSTVYGAAAPIGLGIKRASARDEVTALPPFPPRSSKRPTWIRAPKAEPMMIQQFSVIPSTHYDGNSTCTAASVPSSPPRPKIPKRLSSYGKSGSVEPAVVKEVSGVLRERAIHPAHRKLGSVWDGSGPASQLSMGDLEALREKVRRKRETLLERGMAVGVAF